MKRAIIAGSALASYCVEQFGTQKLVDITQENLDARIQEFVALSNYDMVYQAN